MRFSHILAIMEAHTKLLRHLIGEMALMHVSNQGGRVLKFFFNF